MRQLVHVLLDQRLEVEHHPRPALRVGCGPAGLRLLRGSDRSIEIGLGTEADLSLDLAGIGIEHLTGARSTAARIAGDQMIDDTHDALRKTWPENPFSLYPTTHFCIQ